MDQTRELRMKFTLSNDEWNKLEKYAVNNHLPLEEYLHWYFNNALLQALKNGAIEDFFMNEGCDYDVVKTLNEHLRTPYKTETDHE